MWLFLRFYFTPPNSRSLKCLAWILFEESTQMNRVQYWFMRLCCQHEMLTFKQHHDHNSRAKLETSFRCSRSVKTHRETEISRVWLSVCVWGWNEQTKVKGTAWWRNLFLGRFCAFCCSATQSHLWKPRADTERNHPRVQVQRRRQDPLQLRDGIRFGGARNSHVHCEPGEWCIMGFPSTIL